MKRGANNGLLSNDFTDRFGTERTVIESDGHQFSIKLRGVEFRGQSFDDFEPLNGEEQQALGNFSFAGGCLCECVFECDIPVSVDRCGTKSVSVVRAVVQLGVARADMRGGITSEGVVFSSTSNGRVLHSKESGFFELGLNDLRDQMGSNERIEACINCAFSDYNPAGQGMSGSLACFRDNKDAYRLVNSKQGLFEIWATLTEFVQELHLCPQFEHRVAGAGYRD